MENNKLTLCYFCQAVPCCAVPKEIQSKDDGVSWENYCSDCLPFPGANPSDHASIPKVGEYLYVYFNDTVPYLAFVSEISESDDTNKENSIDCIFQVLYVCHTGKGVKGYLYLRNGQLWEQSSDDQLHAVRWWNQKRGRGWWKSQWRETAARG